MAMDCMARDKQLRGTSLDEVLQKRQLDQALNAKEFAVLAGIAYSTAREWFRLPGFPVIRGVIFWGDFVVWRRAQVGLVEENGNAVAEAKPKNGASTSRSGLHFPARAAQILSEAG